MSRDNAHPALHTPPSPEELEIEEGHRHAHLVPEGWEDLNRGLCPCGEVVAWNEPTETWEAVREMRVLVLTATEIRHAFGANLDTKAFEMIKRQIELQDEVLAYEAAND